jgi:hypothetical protein
MIPKLSVTSADAPVSQVIQDLLNDKNELVGYLEKVQGTRSCYDKSLKENGK